MSQYSHSLWQIVPPASKARPEGAVGAVGAPTAAIIRPTQSTKTTSSVRVWPLLAGGGWDKIKKRTKSYHKQPAFVNRNFTLPTHTYHHRIYSILYGSIGSILIHYYTLERHFLAFRWVIYLFLLIHWSTFAATLCYCMLSHHHHLLATSCRQWWSH